MEMSQGNSLYTYLKQKCHKNREQVLSGGDLYQWEDAGRG
jgi:hypothetical protein